MGLSGFSENPCCCMTVRKGGIFIAVLDIIFGVLGAIAGIYAIFMVSYYNSYDNGDKSGNSTSTTTTTTPPTTTTTTTSPIVSDSSHETLLYITLCMFFIYCIFQVVFGGLLILGIIREKLMLLKAWIGFRIAGVMFTAGTFISFVVLGDKATFQPSIFDGVGVLFSVYCIFVIHVLAQQLKRAQTTAPVKPFKS